MYRDDDESEEEEEDGTLLCSVSVVDIKALETSCALPGSHAAISIVSSQDVVGTSPSSPSSCLDTFSLPVGAPGTNSLHSESHRRPVYISALLRALSVMCCRGRAAAVDPAYWKRPDRTRSHLAAQQLVRPRSLFL